MTNRPNDDQNLEAEDQNLNPGEQDELLLEDLDNVSGGAQSLGGDTAGNLHGKQTFGLAGEPGMAGRHKPGRSTT